MKPPHYANPTRAAEVDRIHREIDQILARLRGSDSLKAVAQEYGHPHLIKRIWHERTTPAQRARARGKKISRNHPGLWKPGHVPDHVPAKGVRFSPATEFKPGAMRGLSARRYRPLGTISVRVDRCGRRTRWIKVDERCDRPQDRWIPLATFLWMVKARRPSVPEGQIVVHLDGDTFNDADSNLEAITRDASIELLRRIKAGFEEKRKRRATAARKQRAVFEKSLHSFHRARKAVAA